MFHFDLTMEDVRLICTEHHVPLQGEPLKDRLLCNELRQKNKELPLPIDVHDGTLDCQHVDAHTGHSYAINLPMDVLAEIIRIGISGDDSARAYGHDYVKLYQEKMKDHRGLSFIP